MMKRAFIGLLFLFFIILIACDSQMVMTLEDNPYYSYQEIELDGGKTMEFALVLPENLVEGETYPVVIVFPPGDQSKDMVESTVYAYWIKSSIMRNWILVSPIAVQNDSYYGGGSEEYIPDLYAWIESNYSVEGNK